jgi:lactoylglutathione lyase
MRIAHIAIWANDLEALKDFYMKYFEMECSEQYHNPKKQFTSYFLRFRGEATAIELMQSPDILPFPVEKGFVNGLTHFAISVGSKDAVDDLTERIERDGHRIVSAPRTTGDGFYESVVEDADGNWVEITE